MLPSIPENSEFLQNLAEYPENSDHFSKMVITGKKWVFRGHTMAEMFSWGVCNFLYFGPSKHLEIAISAHNKAACGFYRRENIHSNTETFSSTVKISLKLSYCAAKPSAVW